MGSELKESPEQNQNPPQRPGQVLSEDPDQTEPQEPGSGVVPAGLLDPPPQDADVVGHHVVEGLQLLLDPPELHGLGLGLFGPADHTDML